MYHRRKTKYTMQLKFIKIKYIYTLNLNISIATSCIFWLVVCTMYDITHFFLLPSLGFVPLSCSYLKTFLLPHIKERKWRNIIENKNICVSFYKFLFNHNNFFADPRVLLMSMIQQKKGRKLFYFTSSWMILLIN